MVFDARLFVYFPVWVYFFLQIKGQDIFWESEKKKTIPAPEDQRVDPLAILYMVNCTCTVCQDTEKVACEHPSRHDFDSRSTIHKMVRMSFKAYAQLPGIFDCSVRRLNMLEDRRSPPPNRVCSCDCSRYLRLVVRSSKIACDYRPRLVLYRSQTGRKQS